MVTGVFSARFFTLNLMVMNGFVPFHFAPVVYPPNFTVPLEWAGVNDQPPCEYGVADTRLSCEGSYFTEASPAVIFELVNLRVMVMVSPLRMVAGPLRATLPLPAAEADMVGTTNRITVKIRQRSGNIFFSIYMTTLS